MNQTTSQSHDFANYSYGIQAPGAYEHSQTDHFQLHGSKVFSRVS
jgi:hypothetical protein